MKVTWQRSDVLVIDDALSVDELAWLVELAEEATFESQDLGRALSSMRTRKRAQIESPEIAETLWAHLAEHLSPLSKWFVHRHHGIRLLPELERWVPTECNQRTRLYRYLPGADFRPHEDEAWRPKAHVRSFLTVLVYLPTPNGCTGGETVIDGETVEARPGRIVVFPHNLWHEGRPVESGEKLVVRNDVIAVGVKSPDPADWLEQGLDPGQVAAVANAQGVSDVEIVRLLTSSFDGVHVGDADRHIRALRGLAYRLGRAELETVLQYSLGLPIDASEAELDAFEEHTSFERKLRALVRADRVGDAQAAIDRLSTKSIAVDELAFEEAKALAAAEVASWDSGAMLLDDQTEEHDFGWTFSAQSQRYVETGAIVDQLIGHGPIIVDRFTAAVWVCSSAVRDSLGIYRATGSPLTVL